ncbi:bolA-like protein 2 [Heterodontus francisci]|uniref:bolA-like protein 2 n=1 Tax=Heterodontus francisci TaxID=7792 RepID=UPI00355B6189
MATPTSASVKERLTKELEAVHVEVEDITAEKCWTSFRVLVVSPKFENKSLLQRHRLVNECLSEEMKQMHALEQKTLSPEQWEKLKAK